MYKSSANILVTGGAGYIGSHVLLEIRDNGANPIVMDNLSRGTRELVPEGVPLIVGDIKNKDKK